MNGERPVTEDDLHAYIDDALDFSRRRQVEAFIDQDADARRRVETYAKQRNALRAALAPYAEEPVPSRLSLARLIERKRRPAPSWRRMAAAAAVIFVAGGAGGWSLRPLSVPQWQTEARPLAQEAADSYRAFEPDHIRPIEVSADRRDDLVNWVSSRLQRRVTAPELADGYRLMGGRLVPTSRGPAAMFMYDQNGVRVVMLICPLSLHDAAPMTESLQDKLSAVSWSEHGMGYSLVGEPSADELRPVAETIRRLIEDKA